MNVDKTVEKKRKFIIDTLYTALIIGLAYVAIRYGLVWLMPFVIGFLVALSLKPVIGVLHKKLGLGKRLAAVVSVLVFYATIGVLITLLLVNLFVWLKALFINLPAIYTATIEPAIYDVFGATEQFFARLDPTLVSTIRDFAQSLSQSISNIVSSLSAWVISSVSGAVTSLPGFLLSVIFAIMSSFFFTIDYDKITAFILRQFPKKGKEIILGVKNYGLGTLWNFCKAYTILMVVTFTQLAIGFSILGIQNAISVAMFIAVMDVLPALGTGSVLIPWMIVELIRGNPALAIGLLVLYLVITVIRNVLEPRIVGAQVGLHPLLMLISMYVGARLFGFVGLFLLPIIIIILKNLNDNGKIHLFK